MTGILEVISGVVFLGELGQIIIVFCHAPHISLVSGQTIPHCRLLFVRKESGQTIDVPSQESP